jgi:hypothetical protein
MFLRDCARLDKPANHYVVHKNGDTCDVRRANIEYMSRVDHVRGYACHSSPGQLYGVTNPRPKAPRPWCAGVTVCGVRREACFKTRLEAACWVRFVVRDLQLGTRGLIEESELDGLDPITRSMVEGNASVAAAELRE